MRTPSAPKTRASTNAGVDPVASSDAFIAVAQPTLRLHVSRRIEKWTHSLVEKCTTEVQLSSGWVLALAAAFRSEP